MGAAYMLIWLVIAYKIARIHSWVEATKLGAGVEFRPQISTPNFK